MRRSVLAVLLKELVDHIRDRRAVLSALVFPLAGPLLFSLVMNVMASWADGGQSVKVAIVAAERAPNLVAFLKQYGVEVSAAGADYEAEVQEGSLDAVVIISEDFAAKWQRGRPAPLQLVVDESRRSSSVRVHRLKQILAAYSGLIATERLMARGVSPELARPVQIDEVDLATPEKLAALLLNMIPIMLVLAAFVGGMNVAIDAMAGERERASLEPLLTNPVPRGALVAGKWLTTVSMAWLSIVITLVGFVIALRRVPLEDLGVKADLGIVEVAGMLLTVLPLALLASAVQMMVSTYARSFKEAQTYLSLLTFVPTIPGMVLAFSPFEPTLSMSMIPVMGQYVLINKLLSGEDLGAVSWVLTLVGIIPLTALSLWFTTRLLHKERIVFGR